MKSLFFSLWKFVDFSCQLSKHKSVFLEILHQSSVSSNISTRYLFSSNIIYFGKTEPIKEKVFAIFECSGQNFSNSSCQFLTTSKFVFKFFVIFINLKHNFPVNFKHIHFLLWIKGSHQSPNFDTFKCSGEDLPNSSCHFPNHKSVFLQILHHSPVP